MRILLSSWAGLHFDPAPSLWTLRRFVREGKYQMAKHDGYTSTRELRDMPAEYLPTASRMTTTASHQAQGAR